MLGKHRGRTQVRCLRQLLTQRFGEIGHIFETDRSFLVNPAKQLDRPVLLLAQPFTEQGQTIKVVVEQIGGHCIAYRE